MLVNMTNAVENKQWSENENYLCICMFLISY